MVLPFKEVIAGVFVIAILSGIGYSGYRLYDMGRKEVKAEWDASIEVGKKEKADKEIKGKEVTTQVVTKYTDRIKVIKEKGETVTVYVDRWLTPVDKDCTIPNSFVELHDATVTTRLPVDNTNNKPSGVTLSQVGATVAGNYNTCEQNAAKLLALQEWITKQKKVYNAK